MVRMTPSLLILKLSWNKERPASDFTLPKKKKSNGAILGE
jgi:hypothetical protein